MPSDIDDLFSELGAPNLTESLGETVTQYPLGNTAAGVVLSDVIVDLSAEGEQPIDDEHGSQRVRYGKLILSSAVNVTVDERAQQRDTFLVRGQIWLAWQRTSDGVSLQTIVIRRTEGASTKRTRVRGG